MSLESDRKLLDAFVQRRDQSAFAALVEAYLPMVFSAALRQARNRDAADEIAQVVFIILARKADSLGESTFLPVWLHRTTRYAALNHVKIENRRRKHERRAAEMAVEAQTPEQTWTGVSPLLDQAVQQLNEKDRTAIMLRYFQHKSVAETGAALGISEDAAGMRLSRAVEKLRRYFSVRGVSTTSALLGSAVFNQAVQAAPEGLAQQAVVHSIAATNSVGSPTLVAQSNQVIHAMMLAKARLVVLTVFLVAVLVVLSILLTQHVIVPVYQQLHPQGVPQNR